MSALRDRRLLIISLILSLPFLLDGIPVPCAYALANTRSLWVADMVVLKLETFSIQLLRVFSIHPLLPRYEPLGKLINVCSA